MTNRNLIGDFRLPPLVTRAGLIRDVGERGEAPERAFCFAASGKEPKSILQQEAAQCCFRCVVKPIQRIGLRWPGRLIRPGAIRHRVPD